MRASPLPARRGVARGPQGVVGPRLLPASPGTGTHQVVGGPVCDVCTRVCTRGCCRSMRVLHECEHVCTRACVFPHQCVCMAVSAQACACAYMCIHVHTDVRKGETTRPVWRGRKNPRCSQAAGTPRDFEAREPHTLCPPSRPEMEAGGLGQWPPLSWGLGWGPGPILGQFSPGHS